MATTTITPEGSQGTVVQFSEHDKLGPLGGKRSLLDDDVELRRVLVAEFQAAADGARDAAASVDRNLTNAVHDFRKALRRARAVLALVASALPKSERRAIGRALREARRALGTARDHAVAPESLSHVTLGEVERATAESIVHSAGDAMPQASELRQLLAEGAARAAAQVEALEAALPQAVSWSTVERGVRKTYGHARAARKSAKRSRRQFHAWRRRSKELGYQLDILGGYAGMRVAELSREIEGVTDTQGPAVDLIMMRDFVRTHSTGIAQDALDGLVAQVSEQIDDLIADSRRAGREAFRKNPRRFVRRLSKAVRRDLAPVVVPDEVD